ncbi:MAG: hypothetical protein GXO29_01520 [Thermotogae bacterium]|nr:hypothetical protein [Thermotogota bacterium]
MRYALVILLLVGCGGEKVEERPPFAPVPHANDFVRRYKEKEIGVPMYPGAGVEYYENDFVIRGKALEARTALRTTDPMEDVVSFYREAFRSKYGEPTYEYRSKTYYMVEKRRDSSTTFPFFVLAVADMGTYRRITIHRLLNYDNINGDGRVLVPIRFK